MRWQRIKLLPLRMREPSISYPALLRTQTTAHLHHRVSGQAGVHRQQVGHADAEHGGDAMDKVALLDCREIMEEGRGQVEG